VVDAVDAQEIQRFPHIGRRAFLASVGHEFQAPLSRSSFAVLAASPGEAWLPGGAA
jgi:hypothetical protein